MCPAIIVSRLLCKEGEDNNVVLLWLLEAENAVHNFFQERVNYHLMTVFSFKYTWKKKMVDLMMVLLKWLFFKGDRCGWWWRFRVVGTQK